MALYISDDYGTTTVNADPLIYLDSHVSYKDNHFMANKT